MSWFIAKIVFVFEDGGNSEFDEQIRLIEAGSEEEAYHKARTLGIHEEDFDLNPERCKGFVDVLELQPLCLGDGASLYSSRHEEKEPKAYINFVHQKGMALRLKARPLF